MGMSDAENGFKREAGSDDEFQVARLLMAAYFASQRSFFPPLGVMVKPYLLPTNIIM
jgi:hypothetical protein